MAATATARKIAVLFNNTLRHGMDTAILKPPIIRSVTAAASCPRAKSLGYV